jgi:preprotein translocase subunit SecY
MFLMWLGEQITERGLGNGISIIIFAGIAAGLPTQSVACSNWCAPGAMHPLTAIDHLCPGCRRYSISLSSSSAVNEKFWSIMPSVRSATKIYGGQSSHLPLKLNMVGVIPPIFASSIILFPRLLQDGLARVSRCAGLKM